MDVSLSQAEIEWLRCLNMTTVMKPVLPLDVQRKFEIKRLVEAKQVASSSPTAGATYCACVNP